MSFKSCGCGRVQAGGVVVVVVDVVEVVVEVLVLFSLSLPYLEVSGTEHMPAKK